MVKKKVFSYFNILFAAAPLSQFVRVLQTLLSAHALCRIYSIVACRVPSTSSHAVSFVGLFSSTDKHTGGREVGRGDTKKKTKKKRKKVVVFSPFDGLQSE